MDTAYCVHCGLCLASCPTYQMTGLESESPRGRLFIMEQFRSQEKIGNSLALDHLDDCLDCRACEAVCPAHIPTGHLVEEFRHQHPELINTRITRPLSLFLGTQRGLRWFQRLARFGNQRGVTLLLQRFPKIIPPRALMLKQGLPKKIPSKLSRNQLTQSPTTTPAVMLFLGCIMDSIYADTNIHTRDLVEDTGASVVAPASQGCCGALHFHAGDTKNARLLAQNNIEAFEASHATSIVINAAGCGAHIKEYHTLFSPDDPWFARAQLFEAAAQDVSEYLMDHPLPTLPPNQQKITMHDACHLAHAQGIRNGPRALLRKAGYQLVEMPFSDRCCGSAGTYNLSHPELADALKREKISDIPADVSHVAMGNPGCMLQIQAGLSEAQCSASAVHTVDLLWKAYHEGEKIRDNQE